MIFQLQTNLQQIESQEQPGVTGQFSAEKENIVNEISQLQRQAEECKTQIDTLA